MTGAVTVAAARAAAVASACAIPESVVDGRVVDAVVTAVDACG